MKAICVTHSRHLEMRDVPIPATVPAGHILVDMEAATITHGDKFFLTSPLPDGSMSRGRFDVYGSNGAGRILAIGADVPAEYAGKQVAIYKTLIPSTEAIGLWSAQALVPYGTALILPDHVRAVDYNGSFANALTVHAFLKDIHSMGHRGVIVTAGTSATGLIAAALTRRMDMPAIFLVRSEAARDRLRQSGVTHVLVTAEEGFEARIRALASDLEATAVFDGLGGALLTRLLPNLPVNTTVYIYGFLGGPTPIEVPTSVVMGRNLTLRRFSNLTSPTVTDLTKRAAAMKEIESFIDDPLLQTRIGRTFRLDEIDQAMAYEGVPGARAVLVP